MPASSVISVIGNRQVLETGCLRRVGHRLDIGPTVRRRCVAVEISTDGRPLNQLGELTRFSCVDFAAILTQLRGNETKTERRVDAVLRVAGDLGVILYAK